MWSDVVRCFDSSVEAEDVAADDYREARFVVNGIFFCRSWSCETGHIFGQREGAGKVGISSVIGQ